MEDDVDQAIIGLANYIEKKRERLPPEKKCKATWKTKAFKRRRSEERMNEVQGKALQFLRETEGVANGKCWRWLQKCHLMKSLEALIMAALSQSLKTNAIKARIDGSQEDASCRMCRSKDETVNHLLSECPKLAQVEYKRRHDNVAKGIHWDLCKQYG